MTPLGLYVHIPFCPQHCPYCAFTVLTGHLGLYGRYVEAVCREMRQWQHLASRGPLHTVFFGGGTPSMLAPAQIGQLLDTAAAVFGIAPEAEITLEANPTTADHAKYKALKAAGINRLSLGAQAFVDADLKTLGRWHSAAEAERAYVVARDAGCTNVNIDVIFSIPGAPRANWQYTLKRLTALQPEHVSTYALTIEEGTQFARRHHQGRLRPVTEDEDAWAYRHAIEVLVGAGYAHYEVSNFARPGWRSRHNWGYWHGAEYLGVGLAAHTYLAGRRQWNTTDMHQYLARLDMEQSPCVGAEALDGATARREQVWLRLRTCEGVQLHRMESSTLCRSPQFEALLCAGLVQLESGRLRLTRAGFPLADAIGVALVDMLESAPGHRATLHLTSTTGAKAGSDTVVTSGDRVG